MSADGANEGWMDGRMEERREEVCISLTAMMECRLDPPPTPPSAKMDCLISLFFFSDFLSSLSPSLQSLHPFLTPFPLSPIFLIPPLCFSSQIPLSLLLSSFNRSIPLSLPLLFHYLASFSSPTLDPLDGSHWFLFVSQNNMSPSWQEAYQLTFCIFRLIYFLAALVLTCTLA